VLIASTGVIGRLYPIDNIRAGIASLPFPLPNNDADDVARGIMTTDTVHKISSATITGSSARVVGVAKGVGMIEPNMATLIAMVFTDAQVEPKKLNDIFRGVINKTLNCVSVDTDTSTSDTAIVLASGAAGTVDDAALTEALHTVLLDLTKAIARDGEGAETLIEVTVDNARDAEQAKTVAKSIVNSPLVKTAVHGADPNWGRVAMAVGKCSQYTEIDQEKVVIRFGTQEVYPTRVDESGLAQLSEYMRGDDVTIHVSLQTGSATATVWGCDLTDVYVRINADYTT
jgi:glutamate N-acetyltransferase/amino-acid N-acetyltransferase